MNSAIFWMAAFVFCIFTNIASAGDKTALSENQHTAHLVPLKQQAPLWSDSAHLISYQCKNMKLIARSRVSPSITYPLSDGMFNVKDCKNSVSSLKKNGCFCDDGLLKCMETEKVQPTGVVCPSDFICFQVTGEETGVLRVKTLENDYTRAACEKELQDLERD